MIEQTILEYLKSKIDKPVALTRNGLQTGEFVVFERIGGGEQNYIKKASIAFQSYADTLYAASALNEKIKEIVKNAIVLPQISGVKLESDYNFTDTSTKKYRYQAIFEITYY